MLGWQDRNWSDWHLGSFLDLVGVVGDPIAGIAEQ